jgi:hypothetical protein
MTIKVTLGFECLRGWLRTVLLQLMLQDTLSASYEGLLTATGMAAYVQLVTSVSTSRAIFVLPHRDEAVACAEGIGGRF